ncbi:cation:proton antiporter [Candidatus Daviesbacteria bacterium]|nr:cation:proton antiporter [Candidatus Daviesbacteria bacterium]
MNNIFIQLAIILGLSSVLGLITYKFKMPLLIAYLVGGLLIALVGFFDVNTSSALSFLPEIGIALLLFLVGMELDLREIRSLGKPIMLAGILQVIITSVLGTFIAQSFGFSLTESIYLGVGLSFSSTIVVIKLLLEKKDLSSLHGKLSVGILLLEDLLAVILLLGLTSTSSVFATGLTQALPILAFIGKVAALFIITLILNHYLLGAIFKMVSGSTELLFLTALAWCFAFISLAIVMGFSVVIGAFLAGVALASSPYHFQIQGKVKPMRDFFVALFFVYLGTKVNFAHITQTIWPILIFTAYAVVVKPAIFVLLLGTLGFRKHTMFRTAINLSHISEFSLIILLVGLDMGLVGQQALTIIASSGLLSIIIASLAISKSNLIYKLVTDWVGFFERKNIYRSDSIRSSELEDHIVIIGAHRVGGEIVKFLKREKQSLVVLDFNPHQVEILLEEGVQVIYGDMEDPEVLDVLNLSKAKMVISTASDTNDSKALLEGLKVKHINIPVVVRADTIKDAQTLYKAGADFVIIPEVMAGDLLLDTIKEHLNNKSYFKDRARIELEKLSRKTLAWG